MTSYFVWSFIYTLFFSLSKSLDPSIRVLINEKQIDDFEPFIITTLKKYIKPIELEPFFIEQKIDMIGTIGLNISYPLFTITNIANDTLRFHFTDKGLIQVDIKGLEGQIDCLYDINSNFYENNGHSNVKVKNISMTLIVNLTIKQNKYEPYKNGPNIQVQFIEFNTLDLSFEFENKGPLEEILISMIDQFKDMLPSIINSNVNKFISFINSELLKILQSLKLKLPIKNSPYILSFSTNQKPIVSYHYIELSFEITFLDNITQKYDGMSYFLPLIEDTSDTFDIQLSQYVIENAIQLLFNQKYLDGEVTSAMLDPFFISVALIGELIPQIKNYFKSGKHVDIILSCVDKPTINFSQSIIELVLEHFITVMVHNSPTTLTERVQAFKADAKLSIVLKARIIEGNITITIDNLSLKKFKVINSNIGEIIEDEILKTFEKKMNPLLDLLNPIMNGLLEVFVKPFFIDLIKTGKINLEIKDHYILVGIHPIYSLVQNLFKSIMSTIV